MRIRYIIFVFAVLLMVGCKSKKNVESTGVSPMDQHIVTVVPQQSVNDGSQQSAGEDVFNGQTNLTARVHVNISVDGKSTSTGGSLKMRKDEVMMVALVDPVLGIYEVGRLEITPEYMMIVDKVNKQFSKVTYSQLQGATGSNVTFDYIQNMVWKEAVNGEGKSLSYTIPMKKQVQISLQLSNVKNNGDWDKKTQVNSKYTEIPFESLVKEIVK